jgi:hypothetical protein
LQEDEGRRSMTESATPEFARAIRLNLRVPSAICDASSPCAGRLRVPSAPQSPAGIAPAERARGAEPPSRAPGPSCSTAPGDRRPAAGRSASGEVADSLRIQPSAKRVDGLRLRHGSGSTLGIRHACRVRERRNGLDAPTVVPRPRIQLIALLVGLGLPGGGTATDVGPPMFRRGGSWTSR